MNPRLRLNHQILLKSPPPPNLPAGSVPASIIHGYCLLKVLAAELRLWFGKCIKHRFPSFFEAGTNYTNNVTFVPHHLKKCKTTNQSTFAVSSFSNYLFIIHTGNTTENTQWYCSTFASNCSLETMLVTVLLLLYPLTLSPPKLSAHIFGTTKTTFYWLKET